MAIKKVSSNKQPGQVPEEKDTDEVQAQDANETEMENLYDMIYELDHCTRLIEAFRQVDKEPDIDIIDVLVRSAQKKIAYFSHKYDIKIPTCEAKYVEGIPDFFERIGREKERAATANNQRQPEATTHGKEARHG